MTYEQIKYSTPDGMPKRPKKTREITPKSALIFFVVAMVIFYIFGAAIQYALGAIGVIITELFFLIISIIYVKWSRQRLKDVFPIKRPKVSAMVGTIILWLGSYMLMVVTNLIVLTFYPEFPENMDSEFITSAGFAWLFMFVIVSIVPAFCEEAMHRGVIQYGMKKKIKNPWIMALVMGLIFGIFHLDISKFLATALLGGVMSWILFQTNNMVYSSFFHFIHNASQMFLVLALPGIVSRVPVGRVVAFALDIDPEMLVTASTTISSGVLIMFLGLLIPFILYTGNWFLTRDIAPRRRPFWPKEKEGEKILRRSLLIPSLLFVLVGFFCIVLGLFIVIA